MGATFDSRFWFVALAFGACNSMAPTSPPDGGADATAQDAVLTQDVIDAQVAPDAATPAPDADVTPPGDASSPDTDPGRDAPDTGASDGGSLDSGRCRAGGRFLYFCDCADASQAFVVACSPDAAGACRLYNNSCTDDGFVLCRASSYATTPGLRERCEAFCAEVTRENPRQSCPR